MKILLVKPYNSGDHIQPSLGLGYLATSIRDRHEVRILDCIKERVDIRKIGRIIKGYNPDVLGLQYYTFDTSFVKGVLKLAKETRKEIVTVVGGPHPSAVPHDTMGALSGSLDFLFAGEAEAGLGLLLDELESGRKDLSSIPGLVWRDGHETKSNPRAVIEDLDKIGMPAWDLIRPETYPESQHGAFYKKFPIAPIMITRGCPYPCTFCAGHVIAGRKTRRRSIDNVCDEIVGLKNNFGIKEFHVIDDNFTSSASYAKEFLRKLKMLDLGMSWAVPNGVRLDTLDEEMLGLMKETGLYLLSAGIESGSDRILGLMKKSLTTRQIRERLKMIKGAGIDVAGFFILGFPGETIESARETIRFASELDLVRANWEKWTGRSSILRMPHMSRTA